VVAAIVSHYLLGMLLIAAILRVSRGAKAWLLLGGVLLLLLTSGSALA
jgi:hypothetical protein